MTPWDLLENAVKGTSFQWVLLVVLLPFVGRAVASSWGPTGVLAAQRALLILFADFVFGLVLALPTHSWPFLFASLPLIGAAMFQERRSEAEGRPIAWLVAIGFALPAITLNHLGPSGWAPVWFVGLLILAGVRGALDPAVEMSAPWVRRTIGARMASFRWAPRSEEKAPLPHPDND